LAAADVNEFLQDQVIMTFAGTAARGSAIGTAVEGMYAHLNDSDTLTYYDGSNWVNRIGASAGILQVQSTAKTNFFTMTSVTFADITDLNVSITPSSATSKILVTLSLLGSSNSATNGMFVRLMRDGTQIALGDADGSRSRLTMPNIANVAGASLMSGFTFLDSPNTTSAVVYKPQVASNTAVDPIYINRTPTDTDAANFGRGVSTITVMEVSA